MACRPAPDGNELRAASESTCHSARSIRPTSHPTRTSVSAISTIRIFSTQFTAELAATAPGFILRCRPIHLHEGCGCAGDQGIFVKPSAGARDRANTLVFPFNQRWGMTFWSALFNPDTRFSPDASKSLEWNRGAYLIEALADCGECHTPRSFALALDNRRKFAGTVTAGWRALDINSDKATGGWRVERRRSRFLLSNGRATGHGSASGPMGEAVDLSFSHV
jgi:mono/diheme cytochrome c family protein